MEPTTNQYSSLCLISTWREEKTMIKRVTVAIVLPSGVGRGQFSIRVAEGGRHLELMVRWPRPLINISLMHKKFLISTGETYTDYHPEFLGFMDALRKLRARAADWVETTTRIHLPFVVESHFKKENLAWKDDETKMVYVRLKAFVEEYAVENDTDNFVPM